MKKQRKKLLCLGLAAMLLASPMTEQNTQAQEVTDVQEVVESPAAEDIVPSTGYKTSGNLKYTELSDGTIEIYDYLGKSKHLVIPQKIKGKKVTSIGEAAFAFNDSLTSVQIPSGVKNIGYCAFANCNNLTSVKLPTTLKSIGECAFWDCSKLKSITIPSKVTKIDDNTFYNCKSLTSIQLLATLKSIGEYAFQNCKSLTTIYLPYGVKSIGWRAFEGCSKLKRIYIPDSVTKIGSSAFDGCKNLTIYCGYSEKIFEYAEDNDLACIYATYVAPDQVSCKVKVQSENTLVISWKGDSDANGYEVYRATSAKGHYTRCKVLTSGSKTSYVDKNLKGGKTYYYKVRGYSTYGSQKLYGAYSKVVKKKVVVVKTPQLDIPGSFNPLILTWSPVKSADKIIVYRSKNGGAYKAIKTLKGSITRVSISTKGYGFDSGNKYRFKIRASYKMDGTTVYSGYSRTITIGKRSR